MKRATVIEIQRQAPQTWEEGMMRFLAWRRSQGAAERTLSGYKENIVLFFRRFPTAWSPACRDCLMQHLSQKGISPATHNARLKVLRPFFEFCVSEGVFSSSPTDSLKYRRESPRIVDHSMEDVKKILDIIGEKTFAALRDSTLLLFQLDTGARPSESLQLRSSDIDVHLRRAAIRPSTSKTGQGRMVFFSEFTGNMLNRLVEVRPEKWGIDVPIFCTGYGEQWNTHSWTVQLRRYAEKAGMKRFSSYDLRHQHAIEFLRNGGDVFTLQRGMGHSTLSMTERYLALSDDDVRRAHEKASPVSAMFPAPRKRIGKL